MTGFDSLDCYNKHINKVTELGRRNKNFAFLKSLKRQSRDNFQSLNLKLGSKAIIDIMGTQDDRFNYGAFRKEINGQSFGVKRVSRECLENRYQDTKNQAFGQMRDNIKEQLNQKLMLEQGSFRSGSLLSQS